MVAPPPRQPQRPSFGRYDARKGSPAPEQRDHGPFAFASPAAQEEWDRRAYRQAVSADNWQLGDEIDDAARDVILADIGGPTRPIYQGPDGKYRFQNERTIEDAATRGHRIAHFAGKTMDQIAAASMPGEEEYVAARRATRVVPTPPTVTARPANDNTPAQAVVTSPAPTTIAANEASSDEAIAEPLLKPSKSKIPGQAFAPRISMDSPSAKIKVDKEAADTVEDYLRLALNGVSGNTSDEMQASVDAFLDMLKGTAEFDAAFAENLKQQQALTSAARERRGTTGALVEMAPNFIPGVGDVSGLVVDFKDYLEHGDEWGPEDWAMVAAGMIPGTPNRRTLKAGKKIIEDVQQAISGNIVNANVADDLLGSAKLKKRDGIISNDEDNFYTEGEARRLKEKPIDFIYTREKPSGSERSRAWEDGAPGQVRDTQTGLPFKPTLRFQSPKPRGRNHIRYDGKLEHEDYVELIERKLRMPWEHKKGMEKAIDQMERSRHALAQNNRNRRNFSLTYEFPDEAEVKRVLILMEKNGFGGEFEVRVGKHWSEL